MRKMICAFMLVCLMVSGAWADVAVTAANFPDDAFRSYVSSNFDTDGDGVLSDAEIAAATGIMVREMGISSLKGIEYFTELRGLDCSRNNISELDVSNNALLEWLTCENNSLTLLDVTHNPALRGLDLNNLIDEDNYNADGSHGFSTLYSQNRLTALDVSNNPNLEQLFVDGSELTAIDLSNNPHLRMFHCISDRITNIDVSNCPELESLLVCDNAITTLDISSNPALISLDVSGCNLTAGDFSNNPNLRFLCYNRTHISHADVSSNTALVDLRFWSTDLEALEVSNCPALEILHCHNSKVTSLTLGNPPSLKELHCENNRLSALDVTQSPALEYLDCGNNQLTELDVSHNPTLYQLFCSYNKITALNVANNSGLVVLQCMNNLLTELDISANANIQVLLFANYYDDSPDIDYRDREGNRIRSIDLSNNPQLDNLQCAANDMNSLDISHNPLLAYIDCGGNNLTTLDVSIHSELQTLHCWGNQLSTLDVSHNPKLEVLGCDSNYLTSINVEANSELRELRCWLNHLDSINVASNTKLESLLCNGSERGTLSALDVSHNTDLKRLDCEGNSLATLDLTNNTALTALSCDYQTVSPLNVTSTGDSSYPYQLNFSSYMSPDKFANVSDVQGLDSSSNNIATTYSDGVAMFASSPASVRYNYATGYGSTTMDVTISGSSDTPYYEATDGNSWENAYIIDSSADLFLLQERVKDGSEGTGKYYKLNADIDMTSVSDWYGIGRDNDPSKAEDEITNPFTGHFDGQNHTVYVNFDYASVFGAIRTDADTIAVRNLNLSGDTSYSPLAFALRSGIIENCNFTGSVSTNGIIDSSGLISFMFGGTVRNCTVTASISSASGSNSAGGIVAFMGGGSSSGAAINNCTVKSGSSLTATHSSSDDNTWGNAGGIAGVADGGTISDCTVEEGVSITASRYAGGVLGFANTTETLPLSGNTWPSAYTQTGNFSASDIEINDTNFPDDKFRAYVSDNFDTDSDGILTVAEIGSATSVDVRGEGISSLLGVEYFSALTRLRCSDNQLSALNVRYNTALIELDCDNNELTALDLSKNTALTELHCNGNNLTTLDVSNNTALTHLYCYENELTSLDVSNNTALTTLDCDSNQLNALDLTRNTALTSLHCSGNQLTTLDLTSNTALTELHCYENELTSLDVSHNTALTELYCYNNEITALNVSNCTALSMLDCNNNMLTALDVTGNTALISLDAGENSSLTTCNVSNNTSLRSLRLNDTSIRTISLSNNTALTTLDLQSSDIEALNVSRNTELVHLNCAHNSLTVLDLTSNSKLDFLNCEDNRLQTLDLNASAPLTDLYCGNQSVKAIRIYSTGNADYPYQADMSEYVTSAKSSRVLTVQAYDSAGNEIQTVLENGIARFAARPESVSYTYNTGATSPLGVSISYSGDIEVVDISTPVVPVSPDETAPVTAVRNSHKYTLFNRAMTWDEAEDYCEELGGHLVTITSQTEQDFIEALLLSGDKKAYWLGGRKNSSGSWYWVDGSTWSYTNWSTSEPDGSGNCLQIYGTFTADEISTYGYYGYRLGGWDDTTADVEGQGFPFLEQHGFICEWDPIEANFAPLNSQYTLFTADPEAYFADSERLGNEPSTLDLSHLADNPPVSVSSSAVFWASASASDSKYDPRQNGRNFRARYQGKYGTCWAFAALGALEASYTVTGLGTAPDLSRLHLAWYANKDATLPPQFGKHQVLDQGGGSRRAIAFLKRAGTAYESDLPYPQNDAEAEISRLESLMRRNPEDYSSVVALGKAEDLDTSDRQRIKDYIIRYGAVAASYRSDGNYYRGEAYYFRTNEGYGHMVNIVGWDDNYSRENFVQDMRPSSNGAWLIKDSNEHHSGTGYFWMSYEQAIGEATAFVASEDLSVFKVYGHDDTASSSTINYHWSANIFRAEGNESIRKIGIETRDNNVSYSIYINKLGKATPDSPGTPGTPSAEGTEPVAGYHVINLSSPVEVSNGEYFSVILKISSSSSYRYYSAVEDSQSIRSAAVISPNESYFALNESAPSPSEWVDGITLESSDIGRACNACVTAYSLPSSTPDTPDTPDTPNTPNIPNIPDTPDNTENQSSGGGGGCSSSVPAFMAAAILAVVLRKKR